jgi:sterol desaturase/sphingolipid hydroxylase (fatty acid hydroxylase superfamily)
MDRIFGKENVLDWLNKYGISIVSAGAFAILLASPEAGIVQSILSLSIMYFWVYFVHRALHFLPTEGPLRYLNTHWIFHHQPLKLLPRSVELCLETINDMVMSLSVLAIQYITGIWLVPPSIILFYALWYTSVHIVNYSIIGSPVHRDHHKNVGTNFGPDVIDQMFGTNHEPTKEDLIPLSPNMVIAFAIVFALKQCVHWIY